jgi:hypothetical protein
MPFDFLCPKCGLSFASGWFDHDGTEDSDLYTESALIVCFECGTQHWMDVSTDDVPCRLRCAIGPLFENVDTVSVESVGNLPETIDLGFYPKSKVHPEHQLRKTIETVECGFCKRTSALTTNWYKTSCVCPHCSELILHGSLWMT